MKIEDLFVENKTELRQLSKLKMELPKDYQNQIYNEMMECLIDAKRKEVKTVYYTYLRLWRGKLVEQMFAACVHKKEFHIKEVQRRVEGNKLIIIKDSYYTMMGGYRSFWEWCTPSWYAWCPSDTGRWIIELHTKYKMTDVFLNKVDSVVKYTGYESIHSWDYTPTEWVTIWRKYPQVEMISKLGYGKYTKSLKFVDACKSKEFFKWLLKNVTQEARKKYGFIINSQSILKCYKHNITLDEEVKNIRAEDKVCHILHAMQDRLPGINLDKERLFKYVRRNIEMEGFGVNSYVDMLEAENGLRLNMEDTKNLYPINFREMHDLYTSQYTAEKKENTDKAIQEVVKKYARTEKCVEGLHFILAKNSNEMIVEGEALEHCVGRCGYNIKMSGLDRVKYPDQTLIFFVRFDVNVPQYTLEYDPKKKKILQFYGEKDKEPSNEVKEIANEWLEAVKKLRFRKDEKCELNNCQH